MTTTRVFKSGNSQAVQLPADFHLVSKEVEVFKRHGEIVIREKTSNLAKAFTLLTQLPEDFFANGREDAPPSK